jgi:hypothetical protein
MKTQLHMSEEGWRVNQISEENEKVSDAELMLQISTIQQSPLVHLLLDATNMNIVLLNSKRQIVFASRAFFTMIGESDEEKIYGKRPGNAIHCIHAEENPTGCGGAMACQRCSALRIVLGAIEKKDESHGEASIQCTINGGERSLNILEHVVPVNITGQELYIVSLLDMTDTVHRRWLERLFYHDLVNKAGALSGYLKLMRREVPDHLKSEVDFIEGSFKEILDDIQYQKWMSEAETGTLKVEIISIKPCEMIQTVAKLYEQHSVAVGKTITLQDSPCDIMIKSDYLLLRRILGNMLKNALEAVKMGEEIKMGCTRLDVEKGAFLEIWVQNSGEMPAESKSHVFMRSWSTKGHGRGMGTYSMKLLGEEILGAQVGFTSDSQNGTRFYIRLPISLS